MMMAPKVGLFLGALWRRTVHLVAVGAVLFTGCRPAEEAPLTADMPLHLEEHLDAAAVRGSEIPEERRGSVEWRFDEPQPGWKTATGALPAGTRPPTVTHVGDALQIIPGDLSDPRGRLMGGAYVDLPGWDQRDWAQVVIRARCSGPAELELGFNLLDAEGLRTAGRAFPFPFEIWGRQTDTPLVGDGTVQTYQLPMEPWGTWETPIDQFGLYFVAAKPVTVEILSITVVPMDAAYAEEPAGVRHVERNNRYRRALFVHTPAQVEYRVRIPDGGRLDTGLGVLWSEPPTIFRVTVTPDGEQTETLLQETPSGRLPATPSIGLLPMPLRPT